MTTPASEDDTARHAKARDNLAVHLPLVQVVAGAEWNRLGRFCGRQMEFADLVGYGMLGLYVASQRWDPALGVTFKTYASRRIKGAILDGVRQWDRLNRGAQVRVAKGRMARPQWVDIEPLADKLAE